MDDVAHGACTVDKPETRAGGGTAPPPREPPSVPSTRWPSASTIGMTVVQANAGRKAKPRSSTSRAGTRSGRLETAVLALPDAPRGVLDQLSRTGARRLRDLPRQSRRLPPKVQSPTPPRGSTPSSGRPPRPAGGQPPAPRNRGPPPRWPRGPSPNAVPARAAAAHRRRHRRSPGRWRAAPPGVSGALLARGRPRVTPPGARPHRPQQHRGGGRDRQDQRRHDTVSCWTARRRMARLQAQPAAPSSTPTRSAAGGGASGIQVGRVAEEEADHRPAGRHEGQQCHRRSRPAVAAASASPRPAGHAAPGRSGEGHSERDAGLLAEQPRRRRCADTSVVRRPDRQAPRRLRTRPHRQSPRGGGDQVASSAPTDARPRRALAPIHCLGGGDTSLRRRNQHLEEGRKVLSGRCGRNARPSGHDREDEACALALPPRAVTGRPRGPRRRHARRWPQEHRGRGQQCEHQRHGRHGSSPSSVASRGQPGPCSPVAHRRAGTTDGDRQVGPTPTRTRRCVPAESAARATACTALASCA